MIKTGLGLHKKARKLVIGANKLYYTINDINNDNQLDILIVNSQGQAKCFSLADLLTYSPGSPHALHCR